MLAVQAHNLGVTNGDFSAIPVLETETGNSMFDDGLHNDGAAGDGVYGTSIPGQPANTLVRYRIEGVGPNGAMTYPRSDEPGRYGGTVGSERTVPAEPPIFQGVRDADV